MNRNGEPAAKGSDPRIQYDSSREYNKMKWRVVDSSIKEQMKNDSSEEPNKSKWKVVDVLAEEPKKNRKNIDFSKTMQIINNHILPPNEQTSRGIICKNDLCSESDMKISQKLIKKKIHVERNIPDSNFCEELTPKKMNLSSAKLTTFLDNSDDYGSPSSSFIENENVNVSFLSDCSISNYSTLSIDRKLRKVYLSADRDSSPMVGDSWCSSFVKKQKNIYIPTKIASTPNNGSSRYSFPDKEYEDIDKSTKRDFPPRSNIIYKECRSDFPSANHNKKENFDISQPHIVTNGLNRLSVRTEGFNPTNVSSRCCSPEREDVESIKGDYPANDTSSWCSFTDRECRINSLSANKVYSSNSESSSYSFANNEERDVDVSSISEDEPTYGDSSYYSSAGKEHKNYDESTRRFQSGNNDSCHVVTKEKYKNKSMNNSFFIPDSHNNSSSSRLGNEERSSSSSSSRSRHSSISAYNGSYISEDDISNRSMNNTCSSFSYDLKEPHPKRPILKRIKETKFYSSLIDIDSIHRAIEERLIGKHDYWIHSRRRKILILGDSHTRFLVFGLKHILPGFTIEAMCKPSAKSEQVISGMDNTIASLTKGDFLILLCGTNDMWGDSIQYAKNFIDYTLNRMRNTNILLCNVPKNYSESKQSHVQQNILEFNKHLKVIVRNVENVNLVKLNKLKERLFFTKHGLHFNATGKIKICELISHKLVDVMDEING